MATDKEIEQISEDAWNAAAAYCHGIRKFETPNYQEWLTEYKQQYQVECSERVYTKLDMLKMAGATVNICNTMLSERIVMKIKEWLDKYNESHPEE